MAESVPFTLVSQPFNGFPSQSPNPELHDTTLHAPLLQPEVAFASEQVLHVAPPMPQLPADWLAYGTHVFPLQQPLGQDDALQTQVPPVLQV